MDSTLTHYHLRNLNSSSFGPWYLVLFQKTPGQGLDMAWTFPMTWMLFRGRKPDKCVDASCTMLFVLKAGEPNAFTFI